MDRFKDRFGLDYLKRDPTKSDVDSLGVKSTEDALLVYGRRLLDSLASSPQHTMRLFDLARQLGVRVDSFYPVTAYLLRKGYVSTVEEDKLGNDLLLLTPAGNTLLAS